MPPDAPAAADDQKPAPPAKAGFNTTEFYFGAATAAGCMTIATSAAPTCVRATALVVAGTIAVAYAFLRTGAKGA